MDKLSTEEEELLVLIKTKPDLQPLFFREAKGLKWFYPLQKEGYFNPENLPSPKKRGEYITVPPWDIANYLANIAPELDSGEGKAYHQEFLSIVENVTEHSKKNEISNYQVWRRFAEILFYISHNIMSDKTIDAVDYWLEDEYGTDLVAEAIGEKLLLKLLNKQDKDATYIASGLLSKLFKVSFKPYPYKNKWQKAHLRFDNHWAKRIIEATAFRVGERLGSKGATVFHDELTRVLKKLKKDGYSSVWQPAIESHDQNSFHDDAENLLVMAYRDSLTGFFQSSHKDAKEYLCKMLDSEYETIQRIAIYHIGRNEKSYENLWDYIIDEKFFQENFRHETWQFLNLNYHFFSNKQRENTLEIIQKKTRNDENGKILKDVSAYIRSIWLAAIKDYSEEEAELYQNQIKITGAEPEHPSFSSYMTSEKSEIVRPSSPYTIKELSEMEITDLIEELKSFKGDGGWEEPSIFGLSQSFKDAIVSDPLRYIEYLDKFKNLDVVYVHSIITGYSECWRKKAEFPWDNIWLHLLQYISKVVRRKGFWDAYTKDVDMQDGYIANRNDVVKAIAALIEDGARSDDHAFDEKHHARIKDILKHLLEHQESVPFGKSGDFDAVTIAINSPRGKCVEALINVALRHCRLADKENNGNHTKTWQEFERYFDKELKREDVNYELFTLIPEYIPNFLYMSKEWFMKNLKNIFSKEDKKRWRCAIQGYSYMRGFAPEVYQHLKSRGYIIDALDDKDLPEYCSSRLVENIVYSFLRNEETLDNKEGLIHTLLSRGKTNEIHQIILTIYSFRSKVRKEITSKVYELWPYVQDSIREKIDFSSENGGKLVTALSLWTVFFKRLDYKMKKCLLEIAPHVNSRYDFPHGLLKNLARISQKQPLEANEIWQAAISGMSKDTYGFLGSKEEVKTILQNLVSIGEEGKRLAKETVTKCAEKGIFSPSKFLSEILNEQKVLKVEEHFKKGIQHYEDGDYDDAISNYTEVIQSDPNHVPAWCNRGLVWRKKEEFEKAISDIDEAIRLDPNTAISWFLRGIVWKDKTDYDKAINDFNQAIRLDSNESRFFVERGRAWKEKYEFDKAIEDFDAAFDYTRYNQRHLRVSDTTQAL